MVLTVPLILRRVRYKKHYCIRRNRLYDKSTTILQKTEGERAVRFFLPHFILWHAMRFQHCLFQTTMQQRLKLRAAAWCGFTAFRLLYRDSGSGQSWPLLLRGLQCQSGQRGSRSCRSKCLWCSPNSWPQLPTRRSGCGRQTPERSDRRWKYSGPSSRPVSKEW